MLEEVLLRMAELMEKSVALQERMVTVAEWNRNRLCGKTDVESAGCQPDAAPETPCAAKAEPAYDELKAALVARGIEIPKGTKMTTLVKLWEKHRSDPIVGTTAAPVEEPVAEAVPADEDIFGDSAPVKEEKKPMTAEEARAILTRNFSGTPEDKQLMLAALNQLGVQRFSDVPEGKFEELVAAFKALKGGGK